jgi:hypothetical protein
MESLLADTPHIFLTEIENYKFFKDIFPTKLLKAPDSGSNLKIQLFPPVKEG